MDSKILCLTRIVGEVTIEKKIEKFKHLLVPQQNCYVRGENRDYFMESARTGFPHEFALKSNECENPVQSAFHAVICLFYTY